MEHYNYNGKEIIGIDHGFGNIKCRHVVFHSGVKAYDNEPAMTADALFYEGKYYVAGEEHKSFGPEEFGVAPAAHENGGFELLQGPAVFRGKILGGCICTLFDLFDGGRYADSPALCAEYGLFPSAEDWKGKILLLESSEERPSPEKYRTALMHLKNAGVFDAVSGLLIGRLPIYFSLSIYILIPWLIRELFSRESALVVEGGFLALYSAFFYYQVGVTWHLL